MRRDGCSPRAADALVATIAARTRSGVAGSVEIRTPTASWMAPRMAGAVGMSAGSPTPFAPYGPDGSASSTRIHSMSGTSPTVGIR
jgi:hypothetical protein